MEWYQANFWGFLGGGGIHPAGGWVGLWAKGGQSGVRVETVLRTWKTLYTGWWGWGGGARKKSLPERIFSTPPCVRLPNARSAPSTTAPPSTSAYYIACGGRSRFETCGSERTDHGRSQ